MDESDKRDAVDAGSTGNRIGAGDAIGAGDRRAGDRRAKKTLCADDAIGVFDSGMGGLTCVRQLEAILPHENIVYFGDTARIPYGGRSEETVMRYAREDAAFLRGFSVKMIIAACGTVSSVVGDRIFITDMPFTGVVSPACKAAAKASKNRKIGVIGTPATIRSCSYEKVLRTLAPDAQVYPKACPMLVHLVENGYTDFHNAVTRLILDEYLSPLIAAGIDTLILGCTHYPVIEDIIADKMGPGVTLISAGAQAAVWAKNVLESRDLCSKREAKGENIYYVSDSVEDFIRNAGRFLGRDVTGHVFYARVG